MSKIINKLVALLSLLRPQQYYKNVLIFLGAIFSGKLTEISLYPSLLVGFVLLCAMSSVNYIINDLRDREKDRNHPEKMHRPLASGEIPVWAGILLAVVLFFASIGISFFLIPVPNPNLIFGSQIFKQERVLFTFGLLLVFVTSFLYSMYLKRIVFADVTLVAINYVWRAVAGCYLITVVVSPWLIVIGFLFALFLSLSKRRADLAYLESDALSHRSVFKHYSLDLLDQSLTLTGASLLLSYAMYTFQSATAEGGIMILTVPLVSLLLLRYLYVLHSDSKMARKAERIFLDPFFIIVGLIVLMITFIDLYIPELVSFLIPTGNS
ncbi:MAG: UbiA prenyltransferase family protein [Candidatus Hermodarchaeota archaeon]